MTTIPVSTPPIAELSSGASEPGPDLAALCRFGHPAIRAFQGWQRFLATLDRSLDAALREFDLSRNQLTVLTTIGHEEGLNQQDLAERIGLTKASTSQMLTRLESAGLIARVPDARAYALHLTDRSRDLLQRVLPAHQALVLQHFSALTALQQAQLAELTDTLNRAASE